MMTRTIVSLEPAQLRALKARARAQSISVAELVRRLIAESLKEGRLSAAVPSSTYERIVALGASGHSDISDRHDARLGDALRREHDR